jgi:hypothetical protein
MALPKIDDAYITYRFAARLAAGAFFRLTSRTDGARIVKRFSSTDLANYIPDENSLSWKILRRGDHHEESSYIRIP